jgi:hypothetical protein
VLGYATEAYLDSVQRNPAYTTWLVRNPAFGAPHVVAG